MCVKRDEGSTALHKVNAIKQTSTLIAIIMSHLFHLQSPQFCSYFCKNMRSFKFIFGQTHHMLKILVAKKGRNAFNSINHETCHFPRFVYTRE